MYRVDFTGVGRPFDLHQVHPGAKCLAVASQQNRADARVALGRFERIHQRAAQRGVQGIAFFGTVEGKPQNAPLANGMKQIGHYAVMAENSLGPARSSPLQPII